MAHEVFISHAHKDKGIADAICQRLESGSVRCWIAGRDITTNEDWTEVTRNAIGASRLMVLVLSENANAAPHIEREIAHAFYTGRMIIPLRVSDTLPRRDFLFYLGNVRCYDASIPPAEQYLEAFTTIIHRVVHASSAPDEPAPLDPPAHEKKTFHFSDSWIGGLQASHYRTLELLKRVAIAGSLVAVGLLLWFGTRQPTQEAALSGPGPVQDSTPHALEDAPSLKPAYTYSRLGLWAAPNNGPKSSDPPDPQAVQSASPAQGKQKRTTDRQDAHVGNARSKHPTRTVRPPRSRSPATSKEG